MKKFEPADVRQAYNGIQQIYVFPNGYQASVVSHMYSYGGEDGLWELAVLNNLGALVYDTPITDGVIGNLNNDEVQELLAKISELPERWDEKVDWE